MKRQLSDANIFNFKLISAIAGTMSVVFYPLVAADTDTNYKENQLWKSSKAFKGSKASEGKKSSQKLVKALAAKKR